ncbi:hypothetical protein MQE22_08785 [Acidithiobacillus sp. YTS05]|nr:hypothetical protein MQE22_08785 [Acidithiobacillus sp. YTS05]
MPLVEEEKKILATSGNLALVEDAEIVQLGYENYGLEPFYYLANRGGTDQKLQQISERFDSLEEAQEQFRERAAKHEKAPSQEEPEQSGRLAPKVLKKKIFLPIREQELLPAVAQAMEYHVEVVPIVLDEGTQVARAELKPGEKPIAYEVLRRGNELEGLHPQFSPTLDRLRFDARQDSNALEKALQKAQELAAQKLTMDDLIAGFSKATPENQEKLLHSAFRNALDGWKEPEKGIEAQPQENPEKEPAKSLDQDLTKDWPKAPTPPNPSPTQEPERPTYQRQKPVPLLAQKNRPWVLDYGDHIVVTRRAMFGVGRRAQEKREQAVGYALQAAVQRFGQPIHFEGNPAFLRQTAELAVKLGIELEPGSKLAEQIYREVQEREQQLRGNILGFARKAPQQQQIPQAMDLGLER